jgi:hypothetical protein
MAGMNERWYFARFEYALMGSPKTAINIYVTDDEEIAESWAQDYMDKLMRELGLNQCSYEVVEIGDISDAVLLLDRLDDKLAEVNL